MTMTEKEEWINSLRVVDLKEELKKRELPTTGKKNDLAERLAAYVKEHEVSGEAAPSNGAAAVGEEKESEEPALAAETAKEPESAAEQPVATAVVEAPAEKVTAETAAAVLSSAVEPAPVAAAAEPAAAPSEKEAVDVDLEKAAEEEKSEVPAEEEMEPPAAAAPAEAPMAVDEVEKAPAAAKPAGENSKKRAPEGAPTAAAARPSKAPKIVSAAAAAAKPAKAVPAGAAPTRALFITGFVRPFTPAAARELLNKSGNVVAMWMPSVRKDVCYVIYKTKAEAEAAHGALWNLQWPANSASRLTPRYVDVTEAEGAIGKGAGNPSYKVERTEEDGADLPPAEDAAAADAGPSNAGAVEKNAQGEAIVEGAKKEGKEAPKAGPQGVKDLRQLLEEKRRSAGKPLAAEKAAAPPVAVAGKAAAAVGVAEHDEPMDGGAAGMTMEDLFKRTKAKPAIFWLPLAEGVVIERGKARLAAKGTA